MAMFYSAIQVASTVPVPELSPLFLVCQSESCFFCSRLMWHKSATPTYVAVPVAARVHLVGECKASVTNVVFGVVVKGEWWMPRLWTHICCRFTFSSLYLCCVSCSSGRLSTALQSVCLSAFFIKTLCFSNVVLFKLTDVIKGWVHLNYKKIYIFSQVLGQKVIMPYENCWQYIAFSVKHERNLIICFGMVFHTAHHPQYNVIASSLPLSVFWNLTSHHVAAEFIFSPNMSTDCFFFFSADVFSSLVTFFCEWKLPTNR